MIAPTLLNDAAAALEDLAEGRAPKNAQLLAGVVALDALQLDPEIWDRDLMDAVEGLHRLATGGRLDLDDVGRTRAADLACKVRAIAARDTPY